MKRSDKIWIIMAVLSGVFSLATGTEWYNYLVGAVCFLSIVPTVYKNSKNKEPQKVWKN